MADSIDLANDLVDIEVSRALSRMRQSDVASKGTKYCVECEDDMPPARQEMGFKLCVSCAEEAERRKSQFRD